MKIKYYSILLIIIVVLPVIYLVFIHETGPRTVSSSQFKQFRNGDIIFQTSQSRQSQAIQLATDSKYSHMGVIYINNGKYYVYEAVQPVKLTKLDKWIKRGKDNHYVVKRLKQGLSAEDLKKLKSAGERFHGKSYDSHFEWSDKKIYCSELVWKMYKNALDVEIGKLQKLGDFDFDHPAVKKKLNERFGNKIPLDEKVISPGEMYESSELETIYRN
jgi:hypothetical protein